MENCTECQKPICSCTSASAPVMPPSECNTQECPSPNPCPEVIDSQCIVFLGDDKSCGDDVVYEGGDSFGIITSKIVDYFCQRVTTVEQSIEDLPPYVLSVTGDGVDNTDPQNPVIDLSSYSPTSAFAPVAFSGDYNDLDNLPTIVTLYTQDGSLPENRTVTHAGYTLTFDGKTHIKSYSASFADTVYGIRNFSNTSYVHDQRGNGEFIYSHDTFTGHKLSWVDLGNNFPVFTLDAPAGGSAWTTRRINGTSQYTDYVTAGGTFTIRPNQWEIRDLSTNNVHTIKDTLGRWLFTNDASGLQTPLSYSRMYVLGTTGMYAGYFEATDEIAIYASSTGGRGVYAISTNNYGIQAISTNSYGAVVQSGANYALWAQATGANTLGALINGTTTVVTPGASSADTAFAVRNFTDTANLFYIKGNGDIEHLTGLYSIGTTINPNAKFNVYTATVDAAIRGYSDTAAGKAIIAQADGNGAIGIQANALNAGGGTAARLSGTTYSILFNGPIMDDAQNTTPTFPQANGAGEAALLATLAVGRWYYFDNGDGTGTVKVKLS